jgi:hypothetical protein
VEWRERATAHPFQSRSAPEVLLLVVLIAAGAAWATYARTLPSWGPPVIRTALQAAAWSALFACLGLAYRGVAGESGESARSAWRRLGVALLLALLSTQLCRLLLTPALAPAQWSNYFYLRHLVPVALVGIWCAVLLPRETRALLRAVKAKASIAPLPELVVLLVAAAVLVSCADLVFFWAGLPVLSRARVDIILRSAWLTNTLILFSAYALVFTIRPRVATALALVTPLYLMLGLATLAKLKYMHAGVQPLDLLRIPEFLPLFRNFFGAGGIVAIAAALGVWIAAIAVTRRREPASSPPVRRWLVGLFALTILLGLPAAFFAAKRFPWADALLTRLGAPDGQFRDNARKNGFLLSFLSELPIAFVSKPPDYSPATVAAVARKYGNPEAGPPARRGGGGVNLILYLVESFMDPQDLGLQYSTDPLPNLRALQSTHSGGHAIVPEEFGGSANTEFELLTGMSTAFLPVGSLPYRQYLKHAIPSLPLTLGKAGYATTAIQADHRYYYDRERVYRLFDFTRVLWLREVPDVERAPRGGWPSDDAAVKAIVQASRGAHPFFIFAFPSSTHSPYNSGAFKTSDLRILDSASNDAAGEVKEYVNAVRGADRAIATLIEHFRHRPDSTIIAVLGDHLPPLTKDALGTFSARLAGASDAERNWKRRRVPLLVWANFELPREQLELSTNALPSYLLEKMGIAPSGFLAVNDRVRREVPILGRYARGADGRIWHRDSLPDDAGALIRDYRLLEYDLLLGKQYSWHAAAAPPR